MPPGTRCPECGGQVVTTDGLDYECTECGATFDTADLFLP